MSTATPTRGVRRTRKTGSVAGRAGLSRMESGVDILNTVSIAATAGVGTVLFALTLAVEDLLGTRFAAIASLWARWRPRSLVLEVIPSAGSTTSGSYVIGWVADPDYRLGTGDNAVRTVAAMVPSQQRHIASTTRFSIPAESLQKWYLTMGSVDGETSHGAVYGLLAAAVGNLTSDSRVSFSLRLHWTVEFSSPRMPEEGEVETIYAEDDYTPYFTDSISTWASGGYLTLKAKEGGNAVPFPGAMPGKVYKLDTKATLPYVKKNSTSGRISYGVRIPNFSVPALAVFEGLNSAKRFAETGDSANCLPYVSAGDWVKPNNPAWIAQTSSYTKVPVELQAMQRQNDALMARLQLLETKLDSLQQPTVQRAASIYPTAPRVEDLDFQVPGYPVRRS